MPILAIFYNAKRSRRALMMQFHVNLYMFSLVSAFLWNTWEGFVKRLYPWHVYTSRWVCTYYTRDFVRTASAGHGKTGQYGHWLDTKCKSKAVVNNDIQPCMHNI